MIRLAPTIVESDELTTWLIEAALRYAGKPLAISNLPSQPVLFPFTLAESLAYLVSNSDHLTVRVEGASVQYVTLGGVN